MLYVYTARFRHFRIFAESRYKLCRVCLSVRLSARVSIADTGRTLLIFHFGDFFYSNLSIKSKMFLKSGINNGRNT